MPKKPPVVTKQRVRQVVTRTEIVRVDDIYWVKAYNQGNKRYPEADFKTNKGRAHARQVAQRRVNKSYCAEDHVK